LSLWVRKSGQSYVVFINLSLVQTQNTGKSSINILETEQVANFRTLEPNCCDLQC
jgi:hypothetical protein